MPNKFNRIYFKDIIKKYLNGTATKEEQKFIETYYDQFDEQPDGISEWSIQERLRLKNEIEKSIAKSKSNLSDQPSWKQVFRVAASLILLVSAGWFLWKNSWTRPENIGQAENVDVMIVDSAELADKDLYLSDGSVVRLTKGSAIRYFEQFDSNQRVVILNGSAYFDIVRDTLRPFIVQNSGFETRVLGTAFSIASDPYSDAIKVSVTHGKVQVSSEHEALAILEKQEEVILDSETKTIIAKGRMNKQETKTIEPTQFILDNMALSQAKKIIEKRWQCEVLLSSANLGQCQFTTAFRPEDTLEEIITVVCAVIGATFTIEENLVTIKGEGCN